MATRCLTIMHEGTCPAQSPQCLVARAITLHRIACILACASPRRTSTHLGTSHLGHPDHPYAVRPLPYVVMCAVEAVEVVALLTSAFNWTMVAERRDNSAGTLHSGGKRFIRVA